MRVCIFICNQSRRVLHPWAQNEVAIIFAGGVYECRNFALCAKFMRAQCAKFFKRKPNEAVFV